MLSKLFGGWGGGKSSAPPKEEKAAPIKRGISPQEMMMAMPDDRDMMMPMKSGA